MILEARKDDKIRVVEKVYTGNNTIKRNDKESGGGEDKIRGICKKSRGKYRNQDDYKESTGEDKKSGGKYK